MRLLHTADWHLGKTLEGRSRLPEQEQFLEELYQIVVDQNVDAVLMSGDVFDTVNPPALAEQLFYDTVARLADKGKRKVIVIAGNHDHPDRLAASNQLAKEYGITLIGRPVQQSYIYTIASCDQELHIAALPYPSESRLNEVLAEGLDEAVLQQHYHERVSALFGELVRDMSPKRVNIGMSHLFVAGGHMTDSERPIQVGGAYTVRPDAFPSCLDYVALGHLHRPQVMKHPHSIVRYSGSPLSYSFSEAGQAKSVSIIDVNPGEQAQVQELFLSSGKPLVKWKAMDGLSQVYSWLAEGKDQNAWVDLELHVQNSLSVEEIHRLRKEHNGLIHIRPVFELEQEAMRQVRTTNIPVEELFTRFYARQTGGSQPEGELVQLFLELLQNETDEEDEMDTKSVV
ncbi:exonuclease SbcCD subunit D [Bacillus horti]|uniref:Nuclease SbcCD subunit D n=1 Tax=Caldalkalibacillus horti TaxID=77523 RepID=A0ABT9W2F3_9BACI|nr:exonuclease SbcCD subunit D [Bacillus horti]MDQ0167414.1 exonuclease SbcD [Bacillus horti]